MSDDERHSHALEIDLIQDPDAKAKAEVSNGLRQFDAVISLIETHLDPERPFRLRPSTVLSLHRFALEGISAFAGVWRPAGIEIHGSKHKPPGAHLVPSYIETLCDYVNENWETATALHLSAYVLWRLNWIHPFVDGNGRTARAVAYLILCLKLGYRLPGARTVPEQISENKKPYYEALEHADAKSSANRIDVSSLEELLSGYLANQLMDVLKKAGVDLTAET